MPGAHDESTLARAVPSRGSLSPMLLRSLIALLFPATLIALASCGRPSQSPANSNPAVPVEIAVAEKRTVPVELRAIGTVEPQATVELKAKVYGEITAVNFADGATVRAGDPMFTIDPRPFEITLRRAEADAEQAKNEADNAQAQADRYTQLSSQGVASREQFAQILTTASSLRAVLAARKTEVEQARLQLEWATVRAPISGRVGAALLKIGTIVQANTSVLAVINQIRPINVRFALPESTLADVRAWMGRGPVAVAVYHPDTGRELGRGQLDFLDNTVDRESGMIGMKASFPNDQETLWPGQFVDVVISLTQEVNALVVPATAILEGPAGAQVFVVESGVARLRKVGVARTADSIAVVSSGVEAGDQVVTTGQLRLRDGASVRTATAPPAP